MFTLKKMKVLWTLCTLCIMLLSCNNSDTSYEPIPKKVDFNFHIRPILVQNCYLCHGPDPSSRKAGLRLDTFEGATAELKESGYAIVPGNVSKSKLIYRINHHDEDQIMPPPETNSKLTSREKDLLERWIKQGAEWKPHWSFIKPELAKNDKSNIDTYVDEMLEQKDLSKTVSASKNTLIRRVSYTLTGLPPTPTEVSEFIEDKSDDSYEKMVDNYLNSPSYGERWARHWMDLVRYAETKGHEFDYAITGAWQYRDYLIRAFNKDVSYNQLLKEHIAGDLLKEKRYDAETGILESQLGTAFYALGEGTHSPVDIRQDEALRIDNMIDVTTKTFQGLTVSCARCHDHKFDPITAADYYALYGVMESTRFSTLIADQSIEKKKTVQEILAVQHYLKNSVAEKLDNGISNKITKTSKSSDFEDRDYTVLGDFRNIDFDGWVSDGLAFGKETTLGNPVLNKSGKLIALEEGKASSKSLGLEIFGSLRSQNFVLDSDFIGIRARGEKSTMRIIIDNFQLIQNPIYGNLSKSANGSKWINYVFDIGAWKGHKAYIEILPGNYTRHDYNMPKNAFIEAKYAISFNDKWPKEIERQFEKSPLTQKTALINKQLKNGQLNSYFPELVTASDSNQQLANTIKNNSFIYGVREGFGIDSPIFNRGNHQQLSEDVVPRAFLSALPLGGVPFKSKGSGRLELANAMLYKDNPLTSRVMVNRIWHHLFGKGIVESVDNFGLQGKLPSHPELLDHLAVKFQNEGWSIKEIIRYIVSSETFKRSTVTDEELSAKDPTNIYLASFPIKRLESEAIRDGILLISESLDATKFGAPVPTYLTKFMQGRGRPKESGPMNGDSRRSIYQSVRRNFIAPMMSTFDQPLPYSTFGKRDVTNVPSQSLILMNDPFVIEQAKIMAQKLLAQKGFSFDDKISWIYMHAFSRNPTSEEIANASEFIKLLKDVTQTDDTDVDIEVEIWKEYCHSIFNLKEFLYLI